MLSLAACVTSASAKGLPTAFEAAFYCEIMRSGIQSVPRGQVWAAQALGLTQAQTMIQQVLVLHPKSAKAHFVQAELAARQGQIARAREALAEAEKLAPGLPFAKPEAVQSLRAVLAAKPAATAPHSAVAQPPQARRSEVAETTRSGASRRRAGRPVTGSKVGVSFMVRGSGGRADRSHGSVSKNARPRKERAGSAAS